MMGVVFFLTAFAFAERVFLSSFFVCAYVRSWGFSTCLRIMAAEG